jgi:hypothetical protein
MSTAAKLVEFLMYEQGLSVRSYSGRAMYGAECVGVDLESIAQLWALAQAIGSDEDLRDKVSAPTTDSMGLNIIAYWPNLAWPSDVIGPDTQSEEPEFEQGEDQSEGDFDCERDA